MSRRRVDGVEVDATIQHHKILMCTQVRRHPGRRRRRLLPAAAHPGDDPRRDLPAPRPRAFSRPAHPEGQPHKKDLLHEPGLRLPVHGVARGGICVRPSEDVPPHRRVGACGPVWKSTSELGCHRADAATETHNLDFHTGEFVQLMGRIRRGEARDKDYDRLNKVGAKKHADDAEPTVRARRFFFFDPRHRLTSYTHRKSGRRTPRSTPSTGRASSGSKIRRSGSSTALGCDRSKIFLPTSPSTR